ncbi:GNAT family N-acetyltransferase [Niabella yanshanensis]|uniref:GNAT family N-acetyltransferase n=1 Tax=Niabella yanshanensis TaxID=577386 RepID=A0ABZ0W5L3_9BACT|nr:GNAT family N-acetyltransferase [Niabella yanshanensis]WQD38583.1 GNAT family N-acetyltransferase [Niabella yanshanensis]
MNRIDIKLVASDDYRLLSLIAAWYQAEWGIPVTDTVNNLRAVTADSYQFQMVLSVNGKAVATGGIYNHVSLLNHKPDLNVYKKWLAQVYTLPGERGRGYGILLCKQIQDHCSALAFEKIYLFTHTAGPMYEKLGWSTIQRLAIGNRNIAVMEKAL